MLFWKIIMCQSIKLTGAIWLLHLLISSTLIHALVWPVSNHHQDWNLGPQHERHTTYQMSYSSCHMQLLLIFTNVTVFIDFEFENFLWAICVQHLEWALVSPSNPMTSCIFYTFYIFSFANVKDIIRLIYYELLR